ncbi:hypothetical protein CEXT_338781 [Caerostris extrusa]|uniref:Uncharacterized protein n=1 Tax=Caerostris extrusa TaxID=172846 RepID=A0AAV4TJ98_CAEEX|nr:hypothetical protein CEXT_338781 [Caerostris extrusa]
MIQTKETVLFLGRYQDERHDDRIFPTPFSISITSHQSFRANHLFLNVNEHFEQKESIDPLPTLIGKSGGETENRRPPQLSWQRPKRSRGIFPFIDPQELEERFASDRKRKPSQLDFFMRNSHPHYLPEQLISPALKRPLRICRTDMPRWGKM